MRKTVGERIKEVREEQGMSVYMLSKKAKINSSSLYHCEKGLNCPSLEVAARICRVLDISLDWLALAFFDDEEDSERF